MENVTMSVLVVTYKADYKKLKLTLDSILCQNYTDYEIVVADDGSKINHAEELKTYFAEHNFDRYYLQMNEENHGTVKNVLSGLEHCHGKYVKPIATGDCLFDRDTLSKLCSFMEVNQPDYCHGLVRAYRFGEDGTLQIMPYSHPFDINVYRKGKLKQIQKNLIVYSDNACGAAICYERTFWLEYMNKIKDYVRLEDDIFQVLAILEDCRVALFDQYMVWYEVGEGVSTKKHKPGEDPLAQDVDRMYHRLYELHPENRYVRQRNRLFPLYKINNLYLRTFLRFFVNPDEVRYLVVIFFQRKSGAHREKEDRKGFLDERQKT